MFLQIIRDEFKKIFSDKGAILILIIGALLYSIIYYIPYSNDVVKDVKIAVADFDDSKSSSRFIAKLDSTRAIEVIDAGLSLRDLKNQVYKSNISGYLVIEEGFEKNLFKGEQANVSLFVDSSIVITYKEVLSAVHSVSSYFGSQFEIANLINIKKSPESARAQIEPIEFKQIPLFNVSGGYYGYIFPLVLIMIMQQTLLVGLALINATMREKGVVYNPYAKSIAYVIFAKSSAYVFIYLIHALYFFFLYPIIFKYPSYFNLMSLFVVLVYLYCVSFLGHALVYFFKNRENCILALAVMTLPMLYTAGFVWPTQNIPMFINILTNLIPSTPAMNAFIKLNQMGTSFEHVTKEVAILIILLISYFLCACYVSTKIYPRK